MRGQRAWYVVLILVGVIACLHLPPVRASAATDPACITDSTRSTGTFITSAPCGQFRVRTTQFENSSGSEQGVSVRYMIHTPTGTPKAVVVLFPGGRGDAGISGNPSTGQVTSANRNFLVRSAQLFAERGYLAVTTDNPSDTNNYTTGDYDQYRVSPRHAQDIVSVLSAANPPNTLNRHVFLAGTSRGALSAFAQHRLGIGSLLWSPVTAPVLGLLHLGHSSHPELQAGSMTVPTHVLRIDTMRVR